MPNTVKSFTYTTKKKKKKKKKKTARTSLPASSAWQNVLLQESELVSSRVSRYEIRLKRCKNVIIKEIIKQMFIYKSLSKTLSRLYNTDIGR